MIDSDEVEKALLYLATSAKDYAEARGNAEWLDEQRKIVRSEAFRQAKAGGIGVAEAEAAAYTAPEYAEAVSKLRDAISRETLLKAYREAAEAKIRVWQTMESSRRAANV